MDTAPKNPPIPLSSKLLLAGIIVAGVIVWFFVGMPNPFFKF